VAGAVTLNASTWNLSGDLFVADYTQGSLSLGSSATVNATGSINLGWNSGSNGTVTVDASSLGASSITIGNYGNGSVSLTGGSALSATIINVATGNGGTGYLDLGNVDSGTTGEIVVNSGGTLTGNGYVLFVPTTINSGGHLAADSSHRLQFAPGSNLTLASGSQLDFSLGEENATFVGLVGSDFSADSVVVNISQLAGFGGSSIYDLVDFTGANENAVTLGNFTLGAGVSGYELAINGNVLQLSATAIPEPSTYALLAGAGALGLVMLRRRRLAV
jgi:fibronectin-binding autotransporter adhesin